MPRESTRGSAARLLDEPDGGQAVTGTDSAGPPGPVTVRVLRTGHPHRTVRVQERAGVPVVLRTCRRADGAAVHEAMTRLWNSPFGRGRPAGPGMPEPLGFDARAGELTVARVPGKPLGDPDLDGGALSRAVEVGTLLADLHGSGVVVDRVRDRRALARSVGRRAAEAAADPATPRVVLDATTAASLAVDRAWAHDDAPRRHVLSHGDLSPRTVLVGPRGLVLIDLDRLQMAEPERDLASWTAWRWVSQGARDRPDTAALLGDLVAGYAATARRVPADRAALEVHLAVDLVRIAHGWAALRHDTVTRVRVLRLATALADPHGRRQAG